MTNEELFATYLRLNKVCDTIRNEIRSRNIDWRTLVMNDLLVEAIFNYRDRYKTTLKEAKDAVDAFKDENYNK